MPSRVGDRIRARRRYENMPLIKKICKCGCNTPFETKDKKSRFINITHYNNFRIIHDIKRKRKSKFKSNEYYIKKVNLRQLSI